LTQGNPESRSGFIAMWFANEMNDAWKAIDYGIRQAGYDAVRIDQKQHNNKIDDEIIAGIRRSKLLVADFTGHRGGVYFEAGLAMGIGLPVIWLCRHDHLKEVHFDTRQYNFIVWETHKLEELSKALQNRIEATLGRGPLIGNP
jgi:nucleoside 2-deoxyribosyltransferase